MKQVKCNNRQKLHCHYASLIRANSYIFYRNINIVQSIVMQKTGNQCHVKILAVNNSNTEDINWIKSSDTI